jgi:hypothetical protein
MEKNIDIFIKDVVNEMFHGTNANILNEKIKGDSSSTKAAKRELGNTFQKYYDSLTNDEKETFSNTAKNIGINLDKNTQRKAEADAILNRDDVKGSYEKAVGTMSGELKQALMDYNEWTNPSTPSDRKKEIMKKYGGYSGLRRYLDMADKFSLTPAYDQSRAKDAGINYTPFGTNYRTLKPLTNDDGSVKKDENGNYVYDTEETLMNTKPEDTPEKKNKKGETTRQFMPANKVVGYDIENLDLTNVSDEEIFRYFKTGTRQGHHFEDEKHNPTYGEMADMAKNGDKKALADLKNLYFKAMFNKMLNSKFGYEFKMPTAMYTYGNSKLPEDTLVINFTTAHRCPAWNECLVGYACYARGSEHNYEGLHKKNSNLHMMWQTAHKDPDLLAAMFKVIKMHLINPGNMAGALLENPKTSQKWFKKLNSQDNLTPLKGLFNRLGTPSKNNILSEPNWKAKKPNNNDDNMGENRSLLGRVLNEYIDEAVRKIGPNKPLSKPKGARENLSMLIYSNNFADIFDKQDLNVIKNTPNAFRAKFIRLNEEGDFIGQWLLDAFDEFVGDLKLVGISTAAYTCRNLNFTKIKNIIINASTMNVGTLGADDTGGSSGAIARRFFAVSSELYNRLEDTYVPTGRKLNYIVRDKSERGKGEYDGSKQLVPLHKTGDGIHVKYNPKPYVNDSETTNPEQYTDMFDKNGPTLKKRLYYKCPCGRHGDVLDDEGMPIKMDCYLCRMCYEPKNENVGELYVLVEVHGDNTDSFDMDNANQKRGISNKMTTYHEAKEIFANRLSESHEHAEKIGMELIVNNIITSAKDKIGGIADREAAGLKAESKKFNDILNRIIKG